MIKKVFTDALVQVAIIMSLMRPDLNRYLYDYELEEPEVLDQTMGESLAYLVQTSFHQRSRPHIMNSPKSMVERDIYVRDLIRDLTRPARRRLVMPPRVNLDAWLVSEVTSRGGGPAQAQTGQQEATTSGGSGQATPSGAELSKEEVNLIDLLWQQDVEAGRGLTMGTSRTRNADNKSQSPHSSDVNNNQHDENRENNQNLANNALNNNNNNNNNNVDVFGAAKLAEQNGNDRSLVVNDETGELERPNGLSHELPELDDDISNGAISLEEAVRALEQHIAEDWSADTDSVMYPPQTDYVNAVTSPVMTSQVMTSAEPSTSAQYVDGMTYGRNVQPAVHYGGYTNYGAVHAQPLPSTMFGSPDQGWANSSDYYPEPPHHANFSLVPPSLAVTNTSVAPTYSQNTTMNTAANMTALMSEFDTASLFPNITNVTAGMPALYNMTGGNQSMIDLLDNEDLDMMDLDHLNFTSEASSVRASASSPVSVSDSAVSMGSGGSPLTVGASPLYEYGTAGATGGGEENYPHHKYKYAVQHAKHDFHYYDSDETRLDHVRYDQLYFNSTSNSTHLVDPAYGMVHNHTYMSNDPAPNEIKLEKATPKISAPRDAMKARQMNLPLSYEEIIDIPVEELTGVLQKYKLSEDQVQLIRDIRRRGKNKLAAQNCRKRRIQEIEILEDEVEVVRREKVRLSDERCRLEKELVMVRSGYERLYDNVLRSMTNENGQHYDTSTISLELNSEGRFVLVPRNSTEDSDFDTKFTQKRKK